MNRKLRKILFYLFKFMINFVVYFDTRIYMYLHNKLLKFAGMKLSGTPRFIAKNVKFDDFNLIKFGD